MPDGLEDKSNESADGWPDPLPYRRGAQTVILTIAGMWFLFMFLVLLALLSAGIVRPD